MELAAVIGGQNLTFATGGLHILLSYIIAKYFTNDHLADSYDFWLKYESAFQNGHYLK